MAQDWSAHVRNYVPNADEGVINAIIRYCGIALQKRDSSLVSFTDAAETGRVRENFLKKKLGLTHSDDVLDEAIAAVGERMKGDPAKNRVTVYYLLAEHFGLLGLFGLAEAAPAVSLASVPPPQTLVSDTGGGSMKWLLWLLLGLLLLAALWWLFMRKPSVPEVAAPAITPPAIEAPIANAGAWLSNLATEGTVAIPAGAGVTSELRDGKPVVKVYFDTGKSDLVPAFSATAAGLKSYLDEHAGATLDVSGYNDPTGSAALNAELSKNRAQAVKAALVAAGIADASVALVKPEETTDATVSKDAARRVEVTVH